MVRKRASNEARRGGWRSLGVIGLLAASAVQMACGGGGDSGGGGTTVSGTIRQKVLALVAGSATLTCTAGNGASSAHAMRVGTDGVISFEGLSDANFNEAASVLEVSRSITRDGIVNTLDPGIYVEGSSSTANVSATYARSGSNYVLTQVRHVDVATGTTRTCVPTAGTATAVAWRGGELINPMQFVPATMRCTAPATGASFTLRAGDLVPLREDFQAPIDGANPTAVREQNFAYTTHLAGRHFLHVQVLVESRQVEIGYDATICQ